MAKKKNDVTPGPIPYIALDWTVPDLDLQMKWIRSGSFKMGSLDIEDSSKRKLYYCQDESPITKVEFKSNFWMGTYPVTQEQFRKISKYNPSKFQLEGKNHPVESVSWFAANNFCKKLNKSEKKKKRLPDGYEYRLPTEAEWEYCCRAGTDTLFFFGNSLTKEHAKFETNSSEPWTATVGNYPPNSFGLCDMHGNVSEWCYDWYSPYQGGSITDPAGTTKGEYKVHRGGSGESFETQCRSAVRQGFDPDVRWFGLLGFRIVLAQKVVFDNVSIANGKHPKIIERKDFTKKREFKRKKIFIILPPFIFFFAGILTYRFSDDPFLLRLVHYQFILIIISFVFASISIYLGFKAFIKLDSLYDYVDRKRVNGNFSENDLSPYRKRGKTWYVYEHYPYFTIPLEYDFADYFFFSLARVQKMGKWGFINKFNTIVIDLQYDDAGNFAAGLARVKKNGKWGFLNTYGNVAIDLQYDDAGDFSPFRGLARVKKNEKWGFIDTTGDEIIGFLYDKAHDFNYGLAKVEKDHDFIYLNKNGNTYVEVSRDFGERHVNGYRESLTEVASEDGKYGVIDLTGNEVLHCKYDFVGMVHRSDLIKVGLDGKYGLFNSNGDEVWKIIFDDINDRHGYSSDWDLLLITEKERRFFINKEGIFIRDLI